MNWPALIVFIFFFALVTILGFYAARWRRADLNHLDEWGLGGRRFGTLITWFLLGGDLYTAYTFIAVPALMYGKGALGFYSVPYTIIIYPLVFVVMPRLWSVAKKHGYITIADFIRDRYDSRALALAVTFTGILATMPYIALQLVGMQAVLEAMGITGSGFKGEIPLIIAFAILALYTYTSGLRAPAVIAIVKDLMIYITVIAAVIIIPVKLGGFGHIFSAAAAVLPTHKPPGGVNLCPAAYMPYATLALGSALALFLYPHSLTGVLSSSSRDVIKRNAALLPAYSFILGIIALLGFMAIAAGINTKTPNSAVPLLFLKMFPDWFSGFAFAAIAIGALVPAAIMSIAAANLFTRNIYREYINPACTPKQESNMAKYVSLIVKVGALFFIIFLPTQYAINLQLLGGIWILQTLPAVIVGLYTSWFHRSALLIGWLIGMLSGTYMAVAQGFNSVYPLHIGSSVISAYAAIYALIINFVVAIVFTLVLRAFGVEKGRDKTSPQDYNFKSASL
ncbi:sodium:solute symporter [Aneurinibacillus sp. Ricciae_BoGa-3]|uniref:monocarboxylate uptake permease MctP n=1 Tax=Aneurinibacillus sp. Ricciae_BoGa-3 TaxID=3022697 RepID=UPI0023416E81|nr:sodium:solute symporter [Aneurinibacillus sp. Ricciae_BoGa-3]WCK55283.1 sodium:solute symporter [Aneurinibacillus sp. Ricciae_BoGa-3]